MSDHNHDNHGHDSHGHDDWFRHSSDEALPQQEHAAHVNTTAIGLTLLAIVFGVLLTVVLLSMYFVQYANTRKAEMNEGTGSAAEYMAYRDQSKAMLGTTAWVDRTAGTVNVAIDDAMDAVVAEYKSSNANAKAEWVGPKPTRTSSAVTGHPVDGHHHAAMNNTDAGETDTEEHAHTDG